MSDRPTIRPVTLPRLVELTNACETTVMTTDDIEQALAVSHRRARETTLEANRIGLLRSRDAESNEANAYATTDIGITFLEAVRSTEWYQVSEILRQHSPHYSAFLEGVAAVEPAEPEEVLEELDTTQEDGRYEFNQTSLDVLGDWGERLGAIQRNAFTGAYYRVNNPAPESDFLEVMLSVFEELEETAGVNLSQRYLSVPELRERTCERLRWTRDDFDKALLELANQNIGAVELSGAPVDTEAKRSSLGIKQIDLATGTGLISTEQSTDRVMAGVEQYGKQYYYLAVHDDDISYTPDT
jgi:hypothetical protein